MSLTYLTAKQVAEQLNISDRTVRLLCQRRLLPHARIGVGRGTIRIKQADLESYLNQGEPYRPVEVPAGESLFDLRRRS